MIKFDNENFNTSMVITIDKENPEDKHKKTYHWSIM